MNQTKTALVEYLAADSVQVEIQLEMALSSQLQIHQIAYQAVASLDVLRWLRKVKADWQGRIWNDFMAWDPGLSSSPEDRLKREIILRLRDQWHPKYQEIELCHCRAVPTAKVLRAIRFGADTVLEVGRMTSAGTACGSCRTDSANLIQLALGPLSSGEPEASNSTS